MTRPVVGWRTSGGIVGQSPAIVGLRGQIGRVAQYASNVLISGPSGTGKELVARELHAQSPRAASAFVPVDCASLSGELMASQLFGHLAGAFTGANCDALGCFRAANGGTLFLDEIGELDYALQSRLLRVLQERVVTPVGSHQGQPVDVRIIAATNRDLQAEVAAGRFRDDLFHRLHVVCLRTVALRERRCDIPLLAEAFLHELAADGLPGCELSVAAADVLVNFEWPGNVRQLRNVLEQAVIESESPLISAELVRNIIALSYVAADTEETRHSRRPAAAQFTSPAGSTPTDLHWPQLDEVERQHIAATLEHTFYNRSAAARLLGITRQSLLRKMKQHGIKTPEKRP